MPELAFLVMQDARDFVTDYHLAIPPLRELGWNVQEVPWRAQTDWSAFDAVYIAAPWDYPQHAAEFVATLAAIDATTAMLINPLATVRWNIQKTYLRDLAACGIDVVPSIFLDSVVADKIASGFERFATDRLVIKPIVGANAVDTFVLQRPLSAKMQGQLQRRFAGRACLLQPFIESIADTGERSLFFMNGRFSHAIRKIPKTGDFRVQEEHGASIVAEVAPAELIGIGERMLRGIEPLPVYARGDWVCDNDGRYLLMELELIEPSLYLRTDRLAAGRFARAFDQRFQELTGE